MAADFQATAAATIYQQLILAIARIHGVIDHKQENDREEKTLDFFGGVTVLSQAYLVHLSVQAMVLPSSVKTVTRDISKVMGLHHG